jgi:uncharacterized lipoprotein YmbA
MARPARIALLATFLVAALALAACGGDNTKKNAYIRELTAAQTQYQAKAKLIEADATPTSTPSQDRRTLDRFSAAIGETIAALRAIHPPAEVGAEHRAFVAVFVTWHDDVERFTKAISKPTRRGVERAQRQIAVANQTFNQSLRQAGTNIDAKLASS